jgi:hypothetical protein
MNEARENALGAAVRRGALLRHEVQLERGEQYIRRLWLRPDVARIMSPGVLDQEQLERLKAAFRRFVIGGLFNVVSKECEHPGALDLADIRELKFDPPPFVEVRFKPPKHHLRLFGRFICKDGLVLCSKGLKSEASATGAKRLHVPAELKRCNEFFVGQALKFEWVPQGISESLSNAKII